MHALCQSKIDHLCQGPVVEHICFFVSPYSGQSINLVDKTKSQFSLYGQIKNKILSMSFFYPKMLLNEINFYKVYFSSG